VALPLPLDLGIRLVFNEEFVVVRYVPPEVGADVQGDGIALERDRVPGLKADDDLVVGGVQPNPS